MTTKSRDFAPLFDFSSMAFVGASDSSHFGLGAFRTMTDVGFEGQYFPVNPKRDFVHGTKAYPSISAIPHQVDAVIIAVARHLVLPAFDEAVAKGARVVTVFSGNFGEADEEGRVLQRRLGDRARESGVLLIGPNCMGAASVRNGRALYQGRGLAAAIKGNLSIVSQSGGLLSEFIHYSNARSIGLDKLVSCGNEADVSCADLIDYYADDPATRVIVAIIETVRDPELFVRALEKAAAARKPVIVLKLGVSAKGARSALSHTGALAGDEAVLDALLRQKAAIRARDIDELVDLAAVFSHVGDRLADRPLERAAVIEISGGSCELVCDVAEAAGVLLPEPSPATSAVLQSVLQSYLAPANPVDTGLLWTNPAMGAVYPHALQAFASQDDIDMVVSRFIVPPDGELGALHERLAELDAARKNNPDRFFVVLSPTSNRYVDEWRAALAQHELVFVPGFRRAFSALGKLADYSRRIRRYAPPAAREPRRRAAEPPATTCVVLNEVDAKALMAQAGLPVVPTHLARSEDEAVAISRRLTFPLAVKLMSAQMSHKSDVGGVRLNLRNTTEVAAAFRDFQALVGRTSGAQFDGMSVQNMAPPGLELLLGAHRDPQFGPVLMFGLGGVLVEILKDTVLRIAPITAADAAAMLVDIRASAMLDGVRGRPGIDRGAVTDALLKLSRLMLDQPHIESIDLNPTFGYPEGLLIADARVILRQGASATVLTGEEQ
jgi:acyl-CoA synthetase (NDP forming)